MTNQTPLGSRSNPITLTAGATAEPDTCGSCHYLNRREWNQDTGGFCTLRLPPHYAQVPSDPESRPSNWVDDTDRCDLHKPSGKFYLTSKLIGPGV